LIWCLLDHGFLLNLATCSFNENPSSVRDRVSPMRFTVTLLAALIVALFAVGSAAASTPVGGEATRALGCGDRGDGGEFLARFTHRHDITCKRAKEIEEGAARAGAELCQQTGIYHAWTVTYLGPYPAFDWEYTRGAKSFIFSAQGGC
jgi:hypothetical protein